MSAVADVLNGAADLIERDGWCQGGYRTGSGERCVANAVMVAGDWPSLVYRDALDALCSAIGTSLPTIWNDTPGRTQAEVVAALRAAAETSKSNRSPALNEGPAEGATAIARNEGTRMPQGSEAGCYFVPAQDFDEWLVVGIAVAGGDGWVAGRWDTRDAAVADAQRWTQLAGAAAHKAS